MIANLIAPPMVEPVSLNEMKVFLKLEADADDDLLRAFISAARVHLEHMTGRHFITQSWRIMIEGPIGASFSVPVQPVNSIISASVLSASGDLLTLADENFAILQNRDPATINNLGGITIPTGQRLQIELETGYGPTAEDVPEPLRQAIKLIVAEWYERRLIAEPTQLPSLSNAIQPLIAPYRTVRL